MARKEKAAEEVEVKRTEADAIAAKVKEEESERQAQLDRLAPLPGPPNELASPDSTHTSADIPNHGRAVSESDPIDAISSSWMKDEMNSDRDDANGGDTYDEADDSSVDGIEPDFKIEDRDFVGGFGDLDEEISKLIKSEPEAEALSGLGSAPPAAPGTGSGVSSPTEKGESTSPQLVENGKMANTLPEAEVKVELESKWASHMQLATFRATASKIADEYIQGSGLKLRHKTQRSSVVRDVHAYWQGIEDGKKIDVHRKRIKE